MPRPIVSQAAESLYQILSPLAFDDESLNWPLLNFCEAIAGALQEAIDYGSDWSKVLDIDTVPFEAIPWLAQFVGVVVPPKQPGETDSAYESRIRDYVRGTPGLSRGTPAAIVQAAQQFLTGTKSVTLRERFGGAYQLQVLTWDTETPSDADVIAAVLKQKPAGIVLTYQSLAGQDYQLVFTNHPNYQDVYGDYSTYQGMFIATPGI